MITETHLKKLCENQTHVNIDHLKGYLICALWSSSDSDDIPMDQDHDIYDFAFEAVQEARDDLNAFLYECENKNLIFGYFTNSDIGHDFWLTRVGHGAGFWDRDPIGDGDAITEVCESYYMESCYTGDDGLVYFI